MRCKHGAAAKKSQASIYYIDINEGNKQQNILLGLFFFVDTKHEKYIFSAPVFLSSSIMG